MLSIAASTVTSTNNVKERRKTLFLPDVKVVPKLAHDLAAAEERGSGKKDGKDMNVLY